MLLVAKNGRKVRVANDLGAFREVFKALVKICTEILRAGAEGDSA